MSAWDPYVGLEIELGAESGFEFSDIQIEDIEFETNAMAIKCSRWAYFKDCDVFQLANVALYYNAAPAVRVLYPSGGYVSTKVTRFENCTIESQGYALTDYFNKGWAFDITAKNESGIWTPPDTIHTGVMTIGCEITGWTTNYGWLLRNIGYIGTQGWWINKTSGSVHHRQYCNSDANISAYTYFDGGWAGVRYLAEVIDAGTPGVASTNVWIRCGFTHGGNDNCIPAANGNTSVHTAFAGNIPANINVYKVGATTGAGLGFFAPGIAELAVGGGSAYNVPLAAVTNPYSDL